MLDPQNFDLADWLASGDTGRPAHLCDVYRDLGLITEVEQLEKQISSLAAQTPDDETIAGAGTTTAEREALEERADELYRRMKDSKLTLKIRGLIQPEQNRIVKRVEAQFKDTPDVDLDAEKQYAIFAEAIVQPRFTVDQVRQLHELIGQAQFAKMIVAYQEAMNLVPEVDAPFSRRS